MCAGPAASLEVFHGIDPCIVSLVTASWISNHWLLLLQPGSPHRFLHVLLHSRLMVFLNI